MRKPESRAGPAVHKESAAFLLAWVVAAGCIFIGLGSPPLMDPDEGRNTEVAREMKAARSFLVPLYNGMPYLDKPALYFDAVAASLAVFGENETAARLPSALFGALTLVLVWLFCRRVYGTRTASMAVVVVGTTPLFIGFSRIVIFDMALTFFVCAALLAGFVALEKREEPGAGRWHVLTVLAAALATLVKGPVGFLLPLLGLVVYSRVAGVKGGRRFFSPLHLLVFFLPVLAWFVALSLQRPDLPYYGLVKESLARFTSSAEFHRGAPIYYYIPLIAAVFFPWSLLLPEMVVRGWQRRKDAARADLLLATFPVVVVVFFSISRSKLPGYVLPGVVALGMLTARVFDLAAANPIGAAARLIRRAAVLLTIVSAGAGLVLAAHRFGLLSLLTAFHIPPTDLVRADVWLQPLLIALLVIAAGALAARVSPSIAAMLGAFVLPSLLVLAVGGREVSVYAEARSSRPLARAIQQQGAASGEVAGYRCFAPGLPFYLGRTMTVITEDGHEIPSNYIAFTLKKPSKWPEQVVHLDDVQGWIGSRKQPVLMLTRGTSPDARANELAAARGAAFRQLTPRWWGALIPAQGRD